MRTQLVDPSQKTFENTGRKEHSEGTLAGDAGGKTQIPPPGWVAKGTAGRHVSLLASISVTRSRQMLFTSQKPTNCVPLQTPTERRIAGLVFIHSILVHLGREEVDRRRRSVQSARRTLDVRHGLRHAVDAYCVDLTYTPIHADLKKRATQRPRKHHRPDECYTQTSPKGIAPLYHTSLRLRWWWYRRLLITRRAPPQAQLAN